MKSNEKGFTLVELLASITIMLLLAVVVTVSITKLVKNSKEKISSVQMNLIKDSAALLVSDKIDYFSSNECTYLTLKDLKDYGVLDEKIINAIDNEEISDDMIIKVTFTTLEYGNSTYDFIIDDDNVDGCVRYSN